MLAGRRQVIDIVCVDRVARIEVGTRTAGARIIEFADKAGARSRVRHIMLVISDTLSMEWENV